MGLLAALQCPADPLDDGADGDAPGGVGLRVEEDLGVPDALGGGAGEVGVDEFGEVVLGAQDGHQRVVEVEEGLEVLELVGGAQFVGGGVGQGHAVALREGEGQLGFEGAFDVEVEFCLGEVHGVSQTVVLMGKRGEGRGRFSGAGWGPGRGSGPGRQ